jgi:type I restriction enzyme, S subunit
VTNITIPHTWSMAALCDLGEWRGGGTPSKLTGAYWNGNIPWVSPKDMKRDSICDAEDHITEAAVDNSSTKLIPPDSVLCVTRSGILAHTFPVVISTAPVTVNQDIKALTPFEGIDARYLAWALRAQGRDILQACAKNGTTVSSIESSRLYAYRIPVAPQGEQRRIVSKVEELFSELDNGIENLKSVQGQLKVYRQAVLKNAFEGKLTAQWREEKRNKLGNADQLFESIMREREARYPQQLSRWNATAGDWQVNSAKGKKPPKPRKPIKHDKPSPAQVQKMWATPETWQWLQIGDFAFVTKLAGFEYTKLVRYDDDGDLPVIKAENAGPNGFRPTAYSRVHSATIAELNRSHLDGGELVMVFVGAGTGNVAIVPSDHRFFLGPNIGMIRPESEKINPRYVELFLRSPFGKDMVLASVKAVAQPSLSMGTIRQIPIILPTPLEQAEIVSRLDKQLSLIDQEEADIDEQLLKSDSLRQAILKQAFSGKLGSQDANDEPASILLERISREKAEKDTAKRKIRRKDAA